MAVIVGLKPHASTGTTVLIVVQVDEDKGYSGFETLKKKRHLNLDSK